MVGGGAPAGTGRILKAHNAGESIFNGRQRPKWNRTQNFGIIEARRGMRPVLESAKLDEAKPDKAILLEVDNMAITVGMGDYVYEYQPDWARLPVGQAFRGISGVAVDSRDRVYVFQRQGPPVLVFDPDGNPLAAWPRPS